MSDINIINGQVFIPEQGIRHVGISLCEGKIVAMADKDSLPSASDTIDAAGLVVMPGIIDPHVHLGFCQDFPTDCETETRSALIGGVTTIGCFLGGSEPFSKTFPEIENTINTRAFTDIFPHTCITTQEHIMEIPHYVSNLGLTSFKFFMFCIPGYMPSQTNAFILNGFREVAKFGEECFCSVHAEDSSLMVEGWSEFFEKEKRELSEWADCNPMEAEELGVIIASALAEMSACKINIVHLATSAALKRLREIKQTNPYVQVETLTLYLSLNAASHVDPLSARWSPAVRGHSDQESLWEGVHDGTIATIGTDQDCVNRAGLDTFIKEYGVSGSSAIDALFLPLLLTEGYHKRKIPLEKLVDKVTSNPARLWGIYPKKGTIAVGSDADLVLVDLNREFIVDYRNLHSASDWSLYQDKTLTGQPIMTIKNGKVVMREGEIIEQRGMGKRLRKSS
jgi:dihydropyrimidinase